MLIKVNKNRLTVSEREHMTAGSVGSVFADFEFGPDWAELTRCAVFGNGEMRIRLALDGSRCAVPWEVLRTSGELLLSLRGESEDGAVICTDTVSLGHVHDSMASDDSTESHAPTLDLFTQLIRRIEALEGADVLAHELDENLDMNGHEVMNASGYSILGQSGNGCLLELDSDDRLCFMSGSGSCRLAVATPELAHDAATKQYVDAAIHEAIMSL